MATIDESSKERKRKRESSVASSVDGQSQLDNPATALPAFRSGQAAEGLSESTAPLDLAALPTSRISKLPTFVPAPNGSKFFLTPDVPVNRATFRYSPAGAAEPGNVVLHRSIENAPTHIRFSWEDRSPHVRISQDALAVEGHGGLRSARCNVPVREGKWYVEFHIERADNGDGASNLGKHVRLGWARREASLNGPVGLDGYSYGLRDVTGEAVTLSRLKPYGVPFKQGDVIGMYISLPPKRMANPDDPSDPARLLRKRIPIGLKLQPYFEMAEYPVSKEMKALTEDDEKAPAPVSGKKRQAEVRPTKNTRGNEQGPVRALPVLKDSALAYFVNGQCQGVAFRDIYDYLQLRETPKRQAARDKQSLNLKERHNPFDDGTLGYYPMISLYHDAVVKVNAGPDFAFPPPPDIDNLLEAGDGQAPKRTWRPLCERYEEFVTEMFALDDMEEESARTKLLEKPPEPDPISEERASQLAKRRKRDQARREAKRAETTGSRSGAAGTPSSRTESRAVSVSHRAQSGTPQPTLPRSGGTPASISIPKQLESSPAPSSIDHNFTAGGGQYLEPERDMGGHSSGVSRHQSISAEELRDSPPVKLEELNTSAMPSPSPVEQDLEMETEG